jgi:hypothetical protein
MANQEGPKEANGLSAAKKDEIASLVRQMGNDLRLSSNVSVRIHVQSNSLDLPINAGGEGDLVNR